MSRIGGITGGRHDEGNRPAMLRALGKGARLLDPHGESTVELVADFDRCWLDGAPIEDERAWQRVIAGDRLCDVDGAFALAWLGEDGALRLARDPIGHRSLYFSPLPSGGAVFASTLHAVLASGLVAKRLHLPAVAAYLAFAYVPGAETMVENLFALGPGESVRIEPGRPGTAVSTFWTLPPEGATARYPADVSEEAARDALRADLEAAVRRWLPADRGEPIAASLSGGIDSSAIVALLRRLHDGPLRCHSVSFGPLHRNELEFSRRVAAHCGAEHRVVEILPSAILAELDRTMGALSEPNGDPLTVPNTLLFRAASEHSATLFNGEGGDPCFGGPKNAPMLLAELLGTGTPDDGLAREKSYARAHQKCWDEIPEMLQGNALEKIDLAAIPRGIAPWFADARWPSLLNKLTAINVAFKGAHHILPKVEHLSAIELVRPRSPLFDRRIVESAFAIPPRLKRHGSIEKHLLKQAVADLLPAVILDRPKSGMMVPVEGWFQDELLPLARARLLDGLPRYGIFDLPWMERLLDGKLPGLRPRRGVKIWLLVALEAWLNRTFRG